jgi:hypothetical protein
MFRVKFMASKLFAHFTLDFGASPLYPSYNMSEFLASVLKALEEITLKKVITLLAVLLLGLVMLVAYESYTSYFRFNRLDAAANLYQKAVEIDSVGTNRIPELEMARSNLISQINDAIAAKPLSLQVVPSTLKFSTAIVWQYFAGAAVPGILSLGFLIRYRNHPKNIMAAEGGLWLAGLSGTVGIFVKPIYWPIFHIIVLPILVLIGTVAILIPVAFFGLMYQNRDKPKQSAAIPPPHS